jgi:hypothetical protein
LIKICLAAKKAKIDGFESKKETIEFEEDIYDQN